MSYNRGFGIAIPRETNKNIEADRLRSLLALAPVFGGDCLKDIGYYEELEEAPMTGEEILAVLNEENDCFTIAYVVAEVIREVENIELDAIGSDGEDFLVLEPRYPWTNSDKEKELTEEGFAAILSKYLSIVTDDVFEIKEQSWYEWEG